MASRMEVCISVCIYNFGRLATSICPKKWGGQNMLLKIVWGSGPPGSDAYGRDHGG